MAQKPVLRGEVVKWARVRCARGQCRERRHGRPRSRNALSDITPHGQPSPSLGFVSGGLCSSSGCRQFAHSAPLAGVEEARPPRPTPASPQHAHLGLGEPSVDCVCFALVWPHRRGIWGQGVKTWLCIHGARMLWTIVDLQRRLRCRCHGFVALAVPKGPWRTKCGLRVFGLRLASPTRHLGPRSENLALHTRCAHVMDHS